MPLTLFAVPNRACALRMTLAAFAFFCTAAQAQLTGPPGTFDSDFDDDAKPWQEIALQMPPMPVAENLLPFYVGNTVSHAFAIDAKSLSVGSDGVIRYTMVATSQAGAKNISYEGIRCQSFERKLYAFGHPNGSWSRSRRDKWEPIPRTTTASIQHVTLAREYFCRNLEIADNAEKIVDRIRNKRPLNPQY